MNFSPARLPLPRARALVLALVAALILSLLSVVAPVAANAEDGAARSISGVVSLPEDADAALLDDVRVSATVASDETAEADAVATPAADGSYTLAGLSAAAYNVSFDVTGDVATSLEGQAFGVTEEFPEGQVVDLAAGDRADVDASLVAVIAASAEVPVEVAAEAIVPAEEAPAEVAADEAAVEVDADELAEIDRRLVAMGEGAGEPALDISDDDLNDPNHRGTVDWASAGVADGEPAVAAQLEPENAPVYVAAASGSRTISGKVTIPASHASWLAKMRVVIRTPDAKTVGVFAVSSTGAWSGSVAPGTYKVAFTTADSYRDITVTNFFPNKTSEKAGKLVDLRKQNASGINASIRIGVDLEGKITLPKGFDISRTDVYVFNSKGQAIARAYVSSTGNYAVYGVPAGDLWFQAATDNSSGKLQMMQFLRTGGKTKHTPAAGKLSTPTLAGTTANSTISGKINVTGGLPKDFYRAANVYQRVDGVWFPTYLSWLNGTSYTGIRMAKGDYAVEFTAKTGRDVAKGEWYNKKPSRAKANIIKLTGTNKVTGVSGTLTTGSSGKASPFVDVKSNHKFYKEIAWMYFSGTSTGVRKGGKAYYQPKSGVSREAMAAFMYRMNAPANYKAPKKSPFKDVSTKHKFYKEIAWMYSSGLSTGVRTSKGAFYKPKDRVSREAMAAFMFRQYAPKNYKAYGTSFNDVTKKHKFYKEIAWMYSSGLSTGVRSGYSRAYQPKSTVTREAMAAFLYRNALNN